MDSAQKRKLTGAAIIVMLSIIVSRITGFLRTMLIPYKIGVNSISDAYNIAFLVPDLMFNMLVGGAIAAALIPVLSGYLEKKQEEDGWKAVGTFINISFVIMAVVCFLGMVFAPNIIPLVAPGFASKGLETQMLAIKLTRILFPSVSFLMLAGLSTGILNSYNRFAAAAFGPTLYNIGCALSIFIFGKNDAKSVERVAYGVMISALIYFLFQLSFAIKNMKYYSFRLYLKHSGLKRMFKLAIPSLLSSSIVQINVIISARFVTYAKELGTYTAFRLADQAWQLPYGIFAQGIGIAILPTLSAKLAVGDVKEFKNVLLKGLKTVMLLSIPAAVGFVVLGKPIVRAIYQWKSDFDEKTVAITAVILMFFSLALITQSIVAIMNRAFYANNDTKTPLYIGIGTIVTNYALCTILRIYTPLGAAGMALSYSLISTMNAAILLNVFNRRIGGLELKKFFVYLFKISFASIIMGIVLYGINKLPIQFSTKLSQLFYLFFEVLIGSIIYFTLTLLMKIEEAQYGVNMIMKKLRAIMNRGLRR